MNRRKDTRRASRVEAPPRAAGDPPAHERRCPAPAAGSRGGSPGAGARVPARHPLRRRRLRPQPGPASPAGDRPRPRRPLAGLAAARRLRRAAWLGRDPDPRAGHPPALRRRSPPDLLRGTGPGRTALSLRQSSARHLNGGNNLGGPGHGARRLSAGGASLRASHGPARRSSDRRPGLADHRRRRNARRHLAEPRPGRFGRDLHHHAPAAAGQHDLQPRHRRADLRPAPARRAP